MDRSFIERLRRIDEQRRGFPGEHWLTLAAGLWFLRRKGGSLPARLTSKAIGSALLWRAASGKEGLRSLWGKRPEVFSHAELPRAALERDAFRAESSSMRMGGPATQSTGAVRPSDGEAPRSAAPRSADDPKAEQAFGLPENRTGGFPDFR